MRREEVQARLHPDAHQRHVRPNARLSLNSVDEYSAEFVDRSFRMRASSTTLFSLVCFLVIAATLLYAALWLAWPNYEQEKFGAGELLVAILPVVLVATAASMMTFRRTLCRELFTHTYYLVRLDRERGFVHVSRHNGPGGVLSVPWKDVHWLVGHRERQEYFLDVRGAVLDHNQVHDRFSVGHHFDDGAQESVRAFALHAFHDLLPDHAGHDVVALDGVEFLQDARLAFIGADEQRSGASPGAAVLGWRDVGSRIAARRCSGWSAP